MTELKNRKCVPCHGGMPTLTEQAIGAYMGIIDGSWRRERIGIKGEAIVRKLSFRNFKEALAFFNKVAEIAEEEGHHPDMGIYGWKNVRLSLTTHAVHGLTDNDFVMAAKIDALAAQ